MKIYTDTLETGESVYMIASGAKRASRLFYIMRWKHITILLNIYIVDKSLFVGTICNCVRNTRDKQET